MSRSYSLLGIRRQNVWANTVFASAFVVVILALVGPADIIKPWADPAGSAGGALGEIEVLGEREILSYDTRSQTASEHLLFGLGIESEPEVIIPNPELGGSWLHAEAGSDCKDSPELSIHLRLNDEAVFGYGLIAPTACGNHRADELDYAIVHGTRLNGVVVLTILEKTDGHLLYRFEGTMSPDGLVGNLAESNGQPIAGGVVFSPDPDAKGRL